MRRSTLGLALAFTLALALPASAQVVKLTTPNAAPPPHQLFGARFGSSVALDGDLLIVGAPLFDVEDGGSGALFVFSRRNDTWVEESRLIPANPTSRLGWSVALEVGAGGTARALVNARFGGAGSGGTSALYVFERSLGPDGPVWTEAAKITVADPGPDEFLVRSVALSGERAIAGAFGAGGPTADGAAYIFRRDPATGLWSEEARFTPPPGAADFARSVALSGDLALVGAPDEDEGPLRGTGAAYAYRYNADGGAWAEEARLVAATPVEGDGFGAALALEGDTERGAAAVVGAVSTSFFGDVSGAAHVLRRAPGVPLEGGAWAEEAKLTGSAASAQDFYGFSVAYAGSVEGAAGDAAVVGARWYPVDRDPAFAGAAYAFRRDGTGGWSETAMLGPLPEVDNEEFGTSVAAQAGAEGLAVLVGAPYDREEGAGAGAAYWFGPGQFVAAEPGAPGAEVSKLEVSTYPNPFISALTVAYTLPLGLAVYDVFGREVAVLADGWQAAGSHRVAFDGRGLPAGVYVVRIEAGGQHVVRQVVLLK